jgi:hypothetical protein
METDLPLLLKLVSDSGLLVLIWLVQLVIYPSFKYYKLQDLKRWHLVYSGKITLVVLPLMLSQLLLCCWLVYASDWDMMYVINSFLVVLTWISTFIIFVPLHQNIDNKTENCTSDVMKLIKYNWIRTFLWTVIFIMTLYTSII